MMVYGVWFPKKNDACYLIIIVEYKSHEIDIAGSSSVFLQHNEVLEYSNFEFDWAS